MGKLHTSNPWYKKQTKNMSKFVGATQEVYEEVYRTNAFIRKERSNVMSSTLKTKRKRVS